MTAPSPEFRRSIVESPWYWVCLFATAGLIGLILIGPKYAGRQAQVESQGINRQRAAMMVRGKSPETRQPHEPRLLITLRPLYIILAGILASAWAILWLRHFRHQRPDTQRPDTQRPDTQRPDTQRPDTQRPDTQRPSEPTS